MNFFEVIKKRKSIRKYKTDPIPAELLEQIFEMVRLAPSWRNGQCWKFVVVTDATLKKALIRCTSVFNQSWLGQEHALVVACGDPAHSGFRNDQAYYLVDVAIAMEHLVLAAAALGLGTCWIGAFDESKVKSLLNIPPTYRVVALTPLGYPAEEEGLVGKITQGIIKSRRRKPLSEVYVINGWE
ncbi:MAG: nitroreductase family protein [candidate division KSB1 bacterium]|nr:nitroreductase family protein [candidate division KSB1 bacterium]MDZ7317950.1 nitroreductase family protein [candidate division KSB1 bacterium]MDZ7342156.1 nitroreductase family protein [candidate division KSB1 bacterium]